MGGGRREREGIGVRERRGEREEARERKGGRVKGDGGGGR